MDLSKLEGNILSLEDYPVEKWNPKLCEGVEFEINADAEWFYNGSKIERIKMVQLFSKLIKYEKGKYFVVTPSEKILVKVKKEIFLITDYKFEENFIMFKTNTDEWIKLTKKKFKVEDHKTSLHGKIYNLKKTNQKKNIKVYYNEE